ncbi:hypothetical protein RvVAT039_02030 [Agrobacterium vitis]|uniref:hypothetical protein n=1 Tax=Agrobacterium vitis TaxID=373 RepID=UPI0012E8DB05|nr:hypothetical protein [Agrobacterium vitis]MVA44708.1 hypothetical protein [Agrobacterium vitis]BCH62987.1 hypothetical protein RvVAT039_02030 [Agrobacterium vitis]
MDTSALILRELAQINRRIDDVSKEGSERGRRTWEKLNEQDVALALINVRVGAVEVSITGHTMTLQQYQELKAKAAGAGWLGQKLLWVGGGVLAAAGWLYSVSETIIGALKWFVGK